MTDPPTIYIVVPCFNEEEVIDEAARRLRDKVTAMAQQGIVGTGSRILFVDDGSRDATWHCIEQLRRNDGMFAGLKLSRNQGHQNALLAGLMHAKERADAVISIDADLQDDVEVLSEFVDAFRAGSDIVYGVRSSRKTDTVSKRSGAGLFYRLMKSLGAEITPHHADYRLMSRRALEALADFPERNLFLRGLIPLIGFSSSTVYYERLERFAGQSKYPLRKMISFAINGITSFSVAPLRVISGIGVIVFIVSVLALIYTLISGALGRNVSGWASIIWSVWILGGVQIVCIGVIGEYLGKVYTETKRRPLYVIEAVLDDPAGGRA
jgi:glycosyltransferase involved in cell wall biosynthesis